MTGLSPDSSLRRAQILEGAGKLFVAHGFEGAKLSMIASEAGAVVGSLTNFYGDKARLAAAVHADALESLIGLLEEQLRRNGPDVHGAIKAVILAYFAWATANPNRQAVFGILDPYAAPDGTGQATTLQARIEQVLAAWAGPIIRAKLMTPLTPAQLFAIIMAPAIGSARSTAPVRPSDPDVSGEWPTLLTSLAVFGIEQAGRKSVRPSKR